MQWSIHFLDFGSLLRNLFLVVERSAGSMHLFTLSHKHHHLHGHLVHSTHFANACNFSFWMLIGTILSGATQSKFTFDLRMNKEASITIWASWEIFAFFRGMNEWALVVGTIREMPTSHLFFAWILFTNLLLKIDSFLSVFSSSLVTGLVLIFWSACIKSLHSFLPGIVSAKTQIFFRFLSSRLLNNSIKLFDVIIGFYNPLFYADLMCGFLPLLVLNYGFEVHIKIMRVLVDSLLWQNLLIFPTNSLQNIWFSLL